MTIKKENTRGINGKPITVIRPGTPIDVALLRYIDEHGDEETRFGDNLADAAREYEQQQDGDKEDDGDSQK